VSPSTAGGDEVAGAQPVERDGPATGTTGPEQGVDDGPVDAHLHPVEGVHQRRHAGDVQAT
jgi:hypothetical protein